jgi:hypothetical protein
MNKEYLPSAYGAVSSNLGHRPREYVWPGNQALKARFNPASGLNPKHTVHRNQARACARVRGIPPERYECDDALVGLLYRWNMDVASPFAKGRG